LKFVTTTSLKQVDIHVQQIFTVFKLKYTVEIVLTLLLGIFE